MSFSGLCIGGPAAGKRVTCQGEFYRCAVRLPPAHAELRTRTFTYRWVVGIDLGRENLTNFWVPEDQDVRWAIGQLLATYEAAHAE
jgi:hypothetical protein